MIDKKAPREEHQQPLDAAKEKKLYKKPAFRYERVFETRALSCGKVFSTVGQCQLSKKTS